MINYFKKLKIRSKKLVANISMALFTRVIDTLIGVYIVPLLIGYLSEYSYGVWITIYSFISWFRFADMGIGNSMRNHLAESIAIGNFVKAKKIVSSAYAFMLSLSLLLIVLFIVAFQFVNWYDFLNVDVNLVEQLPIAILVTYIAFFATLCVKLINAIMDAIQDSAQGEIIRMLSRILTLGFILYVGNSGHSSLLTLAIVFNCVPLITLFFASILLFAKKYKHFAPSFHYIDLYSVRLLWSIGRTFILIQISGIVIFSTDRLIIARIFSPAEVVPYHIAQKYYSILLMAITAINAPMWSAFTEAAKKKDHVWISKVMKMNKYIFFLMSGVGVIFFLMQSKIVGFWLDDAVTIGTSLSIVMLLNVLLRAWGYPYVSYINGVSKIRLQSYILMAGALVNIPLSIFFAKYTFLGVSGVMLATIVSTLYIPLVAPIQFDKLMKGNAKGIWAK